MEQRRSWIIGKFDRANFDMMDITIHQLRADSEGEETVHAGEAKWLDGSWWLFNVAIQKYDADKNPDGPMEYLPRREMLDYREQPADFVNEVKDPLYMSALEIRMYLKAHAQLDDKVVARLSVDMFSRLALPWTCLIVCLFGIPCGVFTGRQGALMGIVAALATFFLFYILMHFSAWLGKSQHFHPLAAAWLPNLVFLTVGLVWIRQLR
ncbi:MAG: LptF/LptG family permease [Lentisphaerae bacterium]|nr:LptF/LptG family permease [Lentisphaerota bacterium]